MNRDGVAEVEEHRGGLERFRRVVNEEKIDDDELVG